MFRDKDEAMFWRELVLARARSGAFKDVTKWADRIVDAHRSREHWMSGIETAEAYAAEIQRNIDRLRQEQTSAISQRQEARRARDLMRYELQQEVRSTLLFLLNRGRR